MKLVSFILIIFCSEVFMQTEFDQIQTTQTFENQETTAPTRSVFGRLWNSSALNTVLLPKCCAYGYGVGFGNCTETSVNFEPKFDVHDHNETAFDDDPIDPKLITFQTFIHNPCEGKKFPLSPEEKPKILLNGSLLVVGLGEYDGILGYDQYCVDNLNDPVDPTDPTVYAFVCIREQKEGYPQWVFSAYMTLITISALMFTSSVIFFHRQDVEGVHKRSYMAYALFMSATYVIIVVMQFIPGWCKGLGLLLQFAMTLTFCWLAILCFDLAWTIHYYRAKENSNRFIFYVGVSAIFSTIFLLISLSNKFTPDIPTSFFKPQFGRTQCTDIDNQHKIMFFTILIITLVISVLSLCYSLLKMNRNRYRNTNQGIVQWKRMSNKFRYMLLQLLLILKAAIIAMSPDIITIFYEIDQTVQVSLLFLQGLHGIFIIIIVGTFWRYMKDCDSEDEEGTDTTFELLRRKNFDLS